LPGFTLAQPLLEGGRVVLFLERQLMVDFTSRGKLALGATVVTAGLAFAGLASAQTMNANSANYNAGYGRVADEENQPVDVSMRDANGNLVVVDGVIQAGQDQSVFSNWGVGGAFDTASGVSTSSGATAVGNQLVVVTEGNNNTVVINSTQTNSGNVSATSSLNGGVQ
jgi:holdfast attachment protein HfaA